MHSVGRKLCVHCINDEGESKDPSNLSREVFTPSSHAGQALEAGAEERTPFIKLIDHLYNDYMLDTGELAEQQGTSLCPAVLDVARGCSLVPLLRWRALGGYFFMHKEL